MNFQDHLKYITLDGHAYMAALWWLNQGFWDGLTDEEKRIVYDGFQHLKDVTRAAPMRNAIPAYEAFKAAGGEIYVPNPEEKAMFQAATAVSIRSAIARPIWVGHLFSVPALWWEEPVFLGRLRRDTQQGTIKFSSYIIWGTVKL